MFQGLHEVVSILKHASRFLVYFDNDVDGLIAGYFVCDFLAGNGQPYEMYINENRQHGFLFEDLEKLRGYTVIAVDFAIPEEKLIELVQHDISIINIDHHELAKDYTKVLSVGFGSLGEVIVDENGFRMGASAVVVNNMYSFEPEEYRYLSGAGVVYNVLSVISPWMNNERNRALVGITLLSDICPIDLNPTDSKRYLMTTYNSTDSHILKLVNLTMGKRDFGYGLPCMDRNFIDFSFSPRVNALLRLNRGKDAIDLIFGHLSNTVDLDEIRQQQRDVVDELLKYNSVNIYENLLLCTLDLEFLPKQEYMYENFLGLIANKHLAQAEVVVVLAKRDNIITRGSARARNGLKRYLDLFQQFGISCAGHQGAFGIHSMPVGSVDFIELGLSLGKAANVPDADKLGAARLCEIDNLRMQSALIRSIALRNIYSKKECQTYLKCRSGNYSVKQTGNCWQWTVDGVESIKAFSEHVTPENGYILPYVERGYVVYYLRNAI